MISLLLKEYNNSEEFLSTLEPLLSKYECQNTVFVSFLKSAMKEQREAPAPQCNLAVWDDKNQFVFALFYNASTGFLYGTYLVEDQPEAVKLCVERFISLGYATTLKWTHAFEPGLGYLKQFLAELGRLDIREKDAVWSHCCEKVDWKGKTQRLRNDPLTELKVATEDMIDTVDLWCAHFLDHYVVHHDAVPQLTSDLKISENIRSGNIYILWYDHVPVSMAWKRRPTENGCSISLVFTPEEFRGHGYAGCCVSMLTETLLKDFKYVTLFVIRSQDPHNNLYTRAGYYCKGAAGRLYVQRDS